MLFTGLCRPEAVSAEQAGILPVNINDSGCQWLSSTMQCELGGCTTTRKCTCTNTHTCTVWVHAQTLKPHNCLHMNKTHCSSALLKGSRSAMKHAYTSLLQDEMTVLLLCVGVCVCNSRKLCQTWHSVKNRRNDSQRHGYVKYDLGLVNRMG